MLHESFHVAGVQAEGYVIPLGGVDLVMVVTAQGLVGCRAIDVNVLGKFGIPAACVRKQDGTPVATLDDVLSGTVATVNAEANRRGVTEGATGRGALGLMVAHLDA